MTWVLAELALDITSAHIVTDARRVRDSFYVRMDNKKLEDTASQTVVSRALKRVIQPMSVAGAKVGAV